MKTWYFLLQNCMHRFSVGEIEKNWISFITASSVMNIKKNVLDKAYAFCSKKYHVFLVNNQKWVATLVKTTWIVYRAILKNKLPRLFENLRLEVRQNMWFQHDGCPAHHSMLAREVLDHDFSGHRISRAAPVNLPDYQIIFRQISFCGDISKTKL